MRLIDADAIEWYGCDFEDYECEHKECKDCRHANCYKPQVDEIPTVQAVPQWIPISERLPEKEGLYLVSVKNDHQRRYSKTCYFSRKNWFARQDIIAWMPLPKPYEPQESDIEWDRVTMIDVNGNTHKVTFKKEDIGDYPDEIPNQFDNLTGSMNV